MLYLTRNKIYTFTSFLATSSRWHLLSTPSQALRLQHPSSFSSSSLVLHLQLVPDGLFLLLLLFLFLLTFFRLLCWLAWRFVPLLPVLPRGVIFQSLRLLGGSLRTLLLLRAIFWRRRLVDAALSVTSFQSVTWGRLAADWRRLTACSINALSTDAASRSCLRVVRAEWVHAVTSCA